MKEWWNNLCVFHVWSKWKVSEENWIRLGFAWSNKPPLPYTQTVQTRTCERCGKFQREEIC